jgi:hypothetical protein
MQTHEAVHSAPVAVNWKVLLGVGAVSAVTMSLTAIWFLLIGFLVFIGTAIAAVVRPSRGPQLLSVGGSIGLGLLVGPTIYLGLAVLT